MLNVQL